MGSTSALFASCICCIGLPSTSIRILDVFCFLSDFFLEQYQVTKNVAILMKTPCAHFTFHIESSELRHCAFLYQTQIKYEKFTKTAFPVYYYQLKLGSSISESASTMGVPLARRTWCTDMIASSCSAFNAFNSSLAYSIATTIVCRGVLSLEEGSPRSWSIRSCRSRKNSDINKDAGIAIETTPRLADNDPKSHPMPVVGTYTIASAMRLQSWQSARK